MGFLFIPAAAAGPPAPHTGSHESTGSDPVDHDALLNFVLNEHRALDDAGASSTVLWSASKVQAEIDSAIVGLYDHKGAYNAATNTPDLDISPSGVLKADAYTVSAVGNFFTEAMEVGDVIIADQDNPTLLSHWTRVQKNIDVATTTTAGIVELATDGENAANVVVQGNDARLSDARTPVAHTILSHDTLATGIQLTTLTDGSNADALHVHASGTPSAHAASHENGGGDEISVAGLSGLLADAQTPAVHTHTHASATGQTANDHHAQLHTIASHSDTTATGAELETLTDGSDADALHTHGAFLENVVEDLTPQLGGPLATNGQQIQESIPGFGITSASAITIPTTGNFFEVLGTTDIDSLSDVAVGVEVHLRFQGILTLNDSVTLGILGGANLPTNSGDIATFRQVGTGPAAWVMTNYVRSSGTPSAHATSHENGGGDEISVAGLSGLLADAQTPTAHTHTESEITDLQAYLLTADINTLAELNAIVTDATLIDTGDSRLSDDRDPNAHTHNASDINAGSMVDARIPSSNVTQHEGSIDHNALLNYAIAQHRIINDVGSSTTELLSASKILGLISAISAGVDVKDPVETVADTNITLSGEQTINGVTTSASRIAVIGQSAPADNGFYDTASGAWTRTADADTDAEVTNGMLTTVLNASSTFYRDRIVLTTADPITVGVTALSFAIIPALDFGTTAGTATEGNDSRILSQDENDAAVGTNGTPSSVNKYVTDSDPRNSDARTPTSHTHVEADITDLQAYLLAADIDTLAELNAILTDATLIDTGDSRLSDARTPTAHTIASHSDTTATGAELETLTDGSNADALHAHTASGVSDFDTEVSNNTSVAANTSKVSNATHTGDVTGSTALTIAAKAVDVAMLADGTDGELLTWDAAGVAATVAVGTVGQVLTSGGAGVAPTMQDAAGGANVDVQKAAATGGSTRSAAGYADLPGATLTTATGATREYQIVFSGGFESDSGSAIVGIRLQVNGVTVADSVREVFSAQANEAFCIALNHAVSIAASQVVKVQWRSNAGGGDQATINQGTLSMLGIG